MDVTTAITLIAFTWFIFGTPESEHDAICVGCRGTVINVVDGDAQHESGPELGHNPPNEGNVTPEEGNP